MAVDCGVTVSRKMLVRGDHSVFRQSVGPGGAKGRHYCRVIRERARPDHRIRRIVVHVNVRSKIDIKSGCRHLFSENLSGRIRIGQCILPGRSDGHISCHTGSAVQADDDTSFLIRRHEIGDMDRNVFIFQIVLLKVLHQSGHLAGTCDI